MIFSFVDGKCDFPGMVANAAAYGEGGPYAAGDVIIYVCNPGYTGGGSTTCQGNRQWSELPACQGTDWISL